MMPSPTSKNFEIPVEPLVLPEAAIRLSTALDIATAPTKPWWLIRPHVERNCSILVVGDFGALKSFLVLHWALVAAAEGHPGVFLHAEGRGLWKRLRAWATFHYPMEDWRAVLSRLPFYAVERPLNLSALSVVDALNDAIRENGIDPALVVVDTLSKHSDGLVESSTEAATAYLNLLDQEVRARYQSTLMLVHHVGHGAADRARGPRALMANTEANFLVERRDPQRLALVVTPGRMKDTETPTPFEMVAHVVDVGELDDEGQPVTSLALEATHADVSAAQSRPTGKNQKLLLAELERLAAIGGAGIWTEGELRAIARGLGMAKNSARDSVLGLRQLGYLIPTVGGSQLRFKPEGTKGRNRDESTNSSPDPKGRKGPVPIGTDLSAPSRPGSLPGDGP